MWGGGNILVLDKNSIKYFSEVEISYPKEQHIHGPTLGVELGPGRARELGTVTWITHYLIYSLS